VRHPARFLRALAVDQRGAALVEFALFAALLLILLFGIIDFGRALFTANNLTAAAREGARYAAVLNNPAGNVPAIQQQVASHMSPFGSAPINPATQVFVTFQSTGSALQSITVQVRYPFTWLTPVRALLGGTMKDTLHAQARFRWEQAQ
jgi:Flp pilus assembly protein TadG